MASHRVGAAVPYRPRLRRDAAAAAEEEERQGDADAAPSSSNGVKSLAVLTKIAVGAGALLGVALALDAYVLIRLSSGLVSKTRTSARLTLSPGLDALRQEGTHGGQCARVSSGAARRAAAG